MRLIYIYIRHVAGTFRFIATELRMTIQTSQVLRACDAARFVGLSESTLAKLRLTGNGPAYCKLGRRVVYRLSDLDAWLQSRRTHDTSDANARFLKALTAAHPR
jgi:predicted DNA-binding transcriptional regulator AlpA